MQNSVEWALPNQDKSYSQLRFQSRLWPHCYRTDRPRPQKPTFTPFSVRGWGESRHGRFVGRGAKGYLIAFAALIAVMLLAVAFSLRGSSPEAARDYEGCIEAIAASQSSSPSGDERGAAMTGCNAKFAGRRKPGGVYSYYDFMQGRSFDIAGPNPTPEERKQIDREYIEFLDAQHREAALAELAKKQDEQLRADLESARQPAGPPLVLTPKIPSPPALKPHVDRSKSTHCEANSLECGWSKLSSVVRDAFASSSRPKP